ncbi:hypothetical protein PHLCEN_2v6648 [Hermanssonia centrifuga]|uniref:COP9 signalosome complex subunit 6 n=1 Tax=Hermanssonia centrifuga TaxID=98765 RepID=A0A2R6NYX7_9APHY|nr:hypothetical protein PHLCEN_2v6648 [Hermanssonia centrifuga]
MENDGVSVDQGFLVARRDQYKQVFPSLEFIGWYTMAPYPTAQHIALHEQFAAYSSTPLLLILQPSTALATSSDNSQSLPFKAFEPTVEIRDRRSRSVFIEAPFTVETGEAERIAVDWTARGGSGGTSLETHLQTQRAAVKMLHERILLLVKYVTEVIVGSAKKDHDTLRSLSALIASLPASENKGFREEFDTEYEDVQLTAYLSTLTKSASILNDVSPPPNLLRGIYVKIQSPISLSISTLSLPPTVKKGGLWVRGVEEWAVEAWEWVWEWV